MPLHVTISAEVMSLRADDLVREALVIAFGVVQVSNKAPILGNYETFGIRGILGMVARSGCMERW